MACKAHGVALEVCRGSKTLGMAGRTHMGPIHDPAWVPSEAAPCAGVQHGVYICQVHGCILCPLGACAVLVQWVQGPSDLTKGSHTSHTTSVGRGSGHLQPKAKSCQVLPSVAKLHANMGK